jgi:hypothetical protein
VITLVYPSLRVEPTEAGSRFTLYWTVRGWAHQRDGWLAARARVSHLRAVPPAVRIVRGTRTVGDVAELEEAMRGMPGIDVTHFTVESDGTEHREESER